MRNDFSFLHSATASPTRRLFSSFFHPPSRWGRRKKCEGGIDEKKRKEQCPFEKETASEERQERGALTIKVLPFEEGFEQVLMKE